MSSTEPRRTALDALHRSLGATMTDFAGWDMPLRYGSERDEHNAVRTRAGLFDLSHMGEITVTGLGPARVLHFALVEHLRREAGPRPLHDDLPRGRRHPGRPDRLPAGDTEYMVVANASNAQVVLDALTGRAAGFDAEVRDDRDAYALLAVQGLDLRSSRASPTSACTAEQLRRRPALGTVAGVPALIARTGYTGEDGFELFVKPEHAVELWQALTKAGEGHGLVPCGLSCRDTLRLEAGMPLYGNELSTSLTPFDAGLGRVVKFEKEGDFVGRAALAEAAERAAQYLLRVLVGLVAHGRRVPRAGYAVVAGGEKIGEVTSGAPPRTLGRPIAMAYVDALSRAPRVSAWTSAAATSRTTSWRCRSTSGRSSPSWTASGQSDGSPRACVRRGVPPVRPRSAPSPFTSSFPRTGEFRP
ncbi:Aminomethyltransferase OS=Streptomyces albaduncus OX=68172 GN=gcvT PE=3 SV=1 [Streptomyces griseoloalbus]